MTGKYLPALAGWLIVMAIAADRNLVGQQCRCTSSGLLSVRAPKVSLSAVTAAERILGRWSGDVIALDSFQAARDSFEIMLGSRLQALGPEVGPALLEVIGRSDSGRDLMPTPLQVAAVHFYLRLDLPTASVESLMLSSTLTESTRLALFRDLGDVERKRLEVGRARTALVCEFALQVVRPRSRRPSAETVALLADLLDILDFEAATGNPAAARLLEDSTVAAALVVLPRRR